MENGVSEKTVSPVQEIAKALCDCSTDMPKQEWVTIIGPDGGKLEVPLASGSRHLLLSTITRVCHDATGLKYRNPTSGVNRMLLMDENESCFLEPEDGWTSHIYRLVCSCKFDQTLFKMKMNAKNKRRRRRQRFAEDPNRIEAVVPNAPPSVAKNTPIGARNGQALPRNVR